MDHYSDIIKGVRKNGTKSQMAFYDLFVRPVWQSAFAIVGNSDDAEEIVQDTMLKVFSKPYLIMEDATDMIRVLKRMAINLAIDTVRKRKDFIVSIEDEPMSDYDVEDADDADADEWEVEDIRDGVNRLPSVYRSVVSLRLFEEMSFAEIAAQLNVNASTVRVQYTRGITRLRCFLEQKKESYETYA
jgi:RNA polymerase sigma-70 factor (ECF subfamily)